MKRDVLIPEPPLARLLFTITTFASLWAIVRIYLGSLWLIAGWHKLSGGDWIDDGAALQGFWTKAAAIPAARPSRRSPTIGIAPLFSSCSMNTRCPSARSPWQLCNNHTRIIR